MDTSLTYQLDFENLIDFTNISKITVTTKLVRYSNSYDAPAKDSNNSSIVFGPYDTTTHNDHSNEDIPNWLVSSTHSTNKNEMVTTFTDVTLDTTNVTGKHKFALRYNLYRTRYDQVTGSLIYSMQCDVTKIKFE